MTGGSGSEPTRPDSPAHALEGVPDATPPTGGSTGANGDAAAADATAPTPADRPVDASDAPSHAVGDPDEPALPRDRTAAPPATATEPVRTSPRATPTGVVYRSTDERNRSVYRRANPWYRRLARGVIATTLIGALGIGIYLGARELRDYLDRDRLPAAGSEVPAIRSTSILVTSTAPTLQLQGTLTFDVDTGAFEFVGTPATPDAGVRLTSPDGATVYREDGDGWQQLPPEDVRAASVRAAVRVLDDDETADAILVNRLRRGYVDLVRQVEEGTGDAELTRYDIALGLTQFSDAFPVQWNEFRAEAIPGVAESRRHVVSIWLDTDDVLVRVDDPETGWSWQRLSYGPSAFEAFEPAPASILEPSSAIAVEGVFCSIDSLGVGFTTRLNSCDEANSVGRDLAVDAGLADDPASAAAELAFAATCVALQDGQTVVDDAATLALAELLHAANVCPGDIERLRTSTEPADGS